MQAYKFYLLIGKAVLKNPELRKGQAAFNLLYEINPRIANEILGTEKDPFYIDSRMDIFVKYLYERGVLVD